MQDSEIRLFLGAGHLYVTGDLDMRSLAIGYCTSVLVFFLLERVQGINKISKECNEPRISSEEADQDSLWRRLGVVNVNVMG